MGIKCNQFYVVIVITIICAITIQTTFGDQLGPLLKTTLHFYVHDTVTGDDVDVVSLIQPNISLGQAQPPFGSIYVTNDAMTEGPERNSTLIGNARGMYMTEAIAADELGIVMYMDFGFTSGRFNGSSLGFYSRNPVSEGVREVAIVGGRNKFRMATGFAKLTDYSFNSNTKNGVIEYNVTVYHYCVDCDCN